jgi:hypothetical protein
MAGMVLLPLEFSVLSLDELWRLVEEDACPMVDDDPFSLDPLPFVQVFVCNTEVSGMPGSHWFAVAYSVKYTIQYDMTVLQYLTVLIDG